MSEEERYEKYKGDLYPTSHEKNVLIDPLTEHYVGLQPHDPLYVNPTRLVEELKHHVYDDYETTDSYAPSEEVIAIDYERILLWLKNHGANSILYCVDVTVNSDDWECLLLDKELEAGKAEWQYLVQPWYRVRFQTKSKGSQRTSYSTSWKPQ